MQSGAPDSSGFSDGHLIRFRMGTDSPENRRRQATGSCSEHRLRGCRRVSQWALDSINLKKLWTSLCQVASA
jgi:hypothetical protein